VIEPWEDPAWLQGAIAWVDEQLAAAGRPRSGEPDQVHVRSWSTVIRIPTADGDAWFKANTPALKHEALADPLNFHTAGWMVAVAYSGHSWRHVACGWC